MDGFTSQVPVPELEGLVHTTRAGLKTGVRRYVSITGINPGLDFRCHNNTVANLRRGVAERVMYLRKGDDFVKCKVPTQEYVDETLGEFSKRLRKKLHPTTPVDIEQMPMYYQGRKRERAQQAVSSLNLLPVSRRDASRKFFTKFEKINFTSKKDPAPRVISACDPRYNMSTGRFLKPAEKLLYKGIARVWGDWTVAKGLNSEDTAKLIVKKWHSFADPCAIGLDASRFDQHFSVPMLRYEHRHHVHQAGGSRELQRLLRWQLHIRGAGHCPDGSVYVETEGCRMSGDMNTASGNCLGMCAMIWSYCKARGVKTKLINNGDDCVVFMDRADESKFVHNLHEWFDDLGFDMKQEPTVYELEKIEFCQAHPIHVGDGAYIMVRNLEASLAKDSLALIQATTPEMVPAWCRAVGDAGTALCGGVPVLDAFYQMYQRSGKVVERWRNTYEVRGFEYMAANMHRRGKPILPETRLSYYVAFGLLPDEQEALERHFASMHIQRVTPSPPTEIPPDLEHGLAHLVQESVAHKLFC